MEDEAELTAAEESESVFGEADDFFSVEKNAAGGRVIEPGKKAEQGALAATGWTHDGDELATGNVEIEST